MAVSDLLITYLTKKLQKPDRGLPPPLKEHVRDTSSQRT